MIESAKEINDLIVDKYIPTSTERKKALLMYFFVGIVMGMSTKEMKKYEIFHLKQATGWWTIFFLCLVFLAFLIFVPYVRMIPLFIFFCMVVVWLLFVVQARKGEYVVGNEKILLPLFSGIGAWIISIFEIEEEIKQ